MARMRISGALSRRGLLRNGAGLIAAAALPRVGAAQAPAVVTSDKNRPAMPLGVQAGDVRGERTIVWSKTDRPARLIVEWSTHESFRDVRRVAGPPARCGSCRRAARSRS